MKIGLLAFLTVDGIQPGALAQKCEALGFELLVFPEHPVIPANQRTPFPRGDGKLPDYYVKCPDPFVALTLAAVATTRLRIGTGICLVPEREPIVTAKQIATLDCYSGGRFVFGIGGGWLREETEVFGANFRRRWPMTVEYVRAMKELWTKDEASFDGEFVKFEPLRCFPKPLTKPHPPVWIGAAGDRAIRNVAAVGDGWMPLGLTPEQLSANLEKLRVQCRAAGRRFEELEIAVTFSGSTAPDPPDLIKRYRDAGAHRLILSSPPLRAETAERELETMARAWIAN